MYKFIRQSSNKGLTLVELMITLAIVLIFVTVSYTFFTYLTQSIDSATEQSIIQENVIMAKNYIDTKVKGASYVFVQDSGDPLPSGGYWNQSFYCIDDADGNGAVQYYTTIDSKETDFLGELTDGYDMQVTFQKVGTSFLEISVTCVSNGGKSYFLKSQVLILGIEAEKFIDMSDDGIGDRICFMSSVG